MVKMPNVALLRRPEWVRSPAGRFLHSLSNPIAAPKTEANKSQRARWWDAKSFEELFHRSSQLPDERNAFEAISC